MKCMKCRINYPDEIIFKLTDKNHTQCLCPNCVSKMESEGSLILENDEDLLCEITRKFGAVVFSSGNEVYILEKDIMHRLLQYDLSPEEYLKIKELKKDNGFQYMIHDDFYTEDGIALQPLNSLF